MKNYNNRGQYTDPIDLPYIQIPKDVYNQLFIEYSSIPETTRMLALWEYFKHYFTNSNYELLRGKDITAHMLTSMLDSRTYFVQNNARWQAYDRGYGQDYDTDTLIELKQKEAKEKKKERNKKDYQKRKGISQIEQIRDGEETLEIMKSFLDNDRDNNEM